MATRQGDDIKELKLDVGLIKADITTIKRDMSSNQKIIIDRMDKFAFVPQDKYADDKVVQKEVDKVQDDRIKALEKYVKDNDSGIVAANKVTGGVGKLIFGALILGVFALIIYFGVLVAPALGGAK